MPSVTCWMVKLPISCWPDVTSVARICANCVGALTLAWMMTLASPLASVTTVSVDASGGAGLLVVMRVGGRRRRSGLRARRAAPPCGPCTVTRRGAGLAGADGVGAAVGEVGRDRQRVDERRRAYRDDDRHLGATGCSGRVLDGDRDVGVRGDVARRASTTVLPATFCATGRTAELRRERLVGRCPPDDRQRRRHARIGDGAVRAAPSAVPGSKELFGAPLPPPQAARASTPARAKRPASESQPGGEEAVFRHDGIPDDVVLKMAGWPCCFECCNKHLAHFVQIKA